MLLRVLSAFGLILLAHPGGARAQVATGDQAIVQRAAEARAIGSEDPVGEVAVLEFFDYSCPTCQAFHTQRGDSLKAFLEEEGVALSMHSYIIPRLPRGYPAAEAALCAGAIGGAEGWTSMHDRLMRNVSAWRADGAGPAAFVEWAAEFGIDEERFTDCLHRDVPAPLVFTDARLAAQFEVSGTPTFVFIPAGAADATEVVSFYGNAPMSAFREALAEARGKAR